MGKQRAELMLYGMARAQFDALFIYDPDAGTLLNRVARGPKAPKGARAGTVDERGYVRIHLGGKLMWAHRIIFFMAKGEVPKLVDHIDRDKSNNRIGNLRNATSSLNAINQASKGSATSGYRGVYRLECNGKFYGWRVRLRVNSMRIHGGSFDCPHKAALAYNTQAIEHCGEFAQLNVVPFEHIL